jgi:hypothetical protein
MYDYDSCPLGISRYRPHETGSDVAIGKHFHSHRPFFLTVLSQHDLSAVNYSLVLGIHADDRISIIGLT